MKIVNRNIKSFEFNVVTSLRVVNLILPPLGGGQLAKPMAWEELGF